MSYSSDVAYSWRPPQRIAELEAQVALLRTLGEH
jgi:hypothetical protein